jgi:hypothetical protein
MLTAPRMHKHHSSGASRPSDGDITVSINDEFNLMAVNPIIECISSDLVTKYCEGLESSTVYTSPPCFVETLPGLSIRSQSCLPLAMHAQAIIPTFLTSTIHIAQCLPKALALTRLQSYGMFKVLLIIRLNKRIHLGGILNDCLLRDVFPYRLARGIPLKEGVP